MESQNIRMLDVVEAPDDSPLAPYVGKRIKAQVSFGGEAGSFARYGTLRMEVGGKPVTVGLKELKRTVMVDRAGNPLPERSNGELVDVDADTRKSVEGEYQIQRSLDGAGGHAPKAYGLVKSYDESGNAYRWALAQEHVQGGTLHEMRELLERRFPDKETRALVLGLSVARALDACAIDVEIVHRDVSLDNMFFVWPKDSKYPRCVLIDFGQSGEMGAGPTRTLERSKLATVNYAAPEMFTVYNPQKKGPSLDTYSVAAIIFEQLTGKYPCQDALKRILAKDRGAGISLEIVQEISDAKRDISCCEEELGRVDGLNPDTASLVLAGLNPNPFMFGDESKEGKRPTIGEYREAIYGRVVVLAKYGQDKSGETQTLRSKSKVESDPRPARSTPTLDTDGGSQSVASTQTPDYDRAPGGLPTSAQRRDANTPSYLGFERFAGGKTQDMAQDALNAFGKTEKLTEGQRLAFAETQELSHVENPAMKANAPTATNKGAVKHVCGTCEWWVDEEGVLTIAPMEGRTEGLLGRWPEFNCHEEDEAMSATSGNSVPKPKEGDADTSDVTLEQIAERVIRWHATVDTRIKKAIVAPGVKATTCFGMFRNLAALTTVDLSGLDTSSVTDMGGMFDGCSALASLDLSGLDTSSVTEMWSMFRNCRTLETLDLSGFDTSSVTNMNYMFEGCASLTSLDLSGFDTSSVADMMRMFKGCASLASLDLSGFDTSSATHMGGMFRNCRTLETLDLSGFDTASVTHMWEMFSGCVALTSLDLSGFDTSAVTHMQDMFSGCITLRELTTDSTFRIGVNTVVKGMFDGCLNLPENMQPRKGAVGRLRDILLG